MEKVEDKEVMVMIVSVLSFFLPWGEQQHLCEKTSLLSPVCQERKKGRRQLPAKTSQIWIT